MLITFIVTACSRAAVTSLRNMTFVSRTTFYAF